LTPLNPEPLLLNLKSLPLKFGAVLVNSVLAFDRLDLFFYCLRLIANCFRLLLPLSNCPIALGNRSQVPNGIYKTVIVIRVIDKIAHD
jgi:hypothetical protein